MNSVGTDDQVALVLLAVLEHDNAFFSVDTLHFAREIQLCWRPLALNPHREDSQFIVKIGAVG
jgi:hypothetical protein